MKGSLQMAKKKKIAKNGKVKKGAWTAGDLKVLKGLFGSRSTAEVAKKLGRGLDAVKKKASRMKLKKAKPYMKKLGRS
jgi:hypothetical protein